ncbi:hypothetical protein TB147_17980 [Klebsiella aerogenes]|uniref:hypothetical protein n=1 Tax=Klebsiella aerogenes TaxID=548 RepID=UPI002E367866|nr:hypothetical protein [Klebsiella aerogenes]MED7793194.1 hypothetical protein [Klebsiella aerogenes]
MKNKHHIIAVLCSGFLLMVSAESHAEVDLGSIDILSKSHPESPLPRGFVVGGAVISGQARYQGQDNNTWAVPGALYFGDNLMYLGDRVRYYFHLDDNVALYGYGRYRFE